MTAYEVRLAVFEGPLDLLLHLVEQRQVDIWQVSMAEIADQYLEFLSDLDEVDLESAGQYLAIAALLVRMKARHLLPYAEPDDEEDEEEDELDFEEALKRQLVEYKRYKEASAVLAELAAVRALARMRPGALIAADGSVDGGPPADFDVRRLTETFAALLAAAPPPPKKPPLLRKVDLHEKAAAVRKRVRAAGGRIEFSRLFTPESSRWEWIVTFLAVLELVHKRELVVRQTGLFGPLELESAG